MARITIEDRMEHVPNRFHLVRMASIRAKQLKKGALPLLSADDNKVVVMSLREIAAGLVKPGDADSSLSTSNADTLDDASGGAVEAKEIQTEEVAPAAESDESTPAIES